MNSIQSKFAMLRYIASIGPAARQDMANGAWDEAMVAALYQAAGAVTVEEMDEARRVARILAATHPEEGGAA